MDLLFCVEDKKIEYILQRYLRKDLSLRLRFPCPLDRFLLKPVSLRPFLGDLYRRQCYHK